MKSILKSFSILSLIALTSCATFEFSLVRKERLKLTKDNIKGFDREYFGASYKRCFDKGEYEDEKRDLTDELFRTNHYENNSRFNSYRIQFLNTDTLLVQGIDTLGNIKFINKIDGKLKRNGYFHLNNKVVDYNGIPYILGGS